MRAMFVAAGVILAAGLAGCGLTSEGNLFREVAQTRGREVAAQTLDNAIWYMCRASPVGSIIDRFAVSERSWGAWQDTCLTAKPAMPETTFNGAP